MNSDLKKSSLIAFVCIALSISFRSGAELCSKAAALYGLHSNVLNSWLLGVILFSGLQVITWTLAIRRFPLTFAYPFMSLGIPLTIFAGAFLFQEQILTGHYIGVTIIVLGVLTATWPNRENPDG